VVTTRLIGVHRSYKFAPSVNSAPGDDVIDRGLGELTAGNLGKMPIESLDRLTGSFGELRFALHNFSKMI
jgi:hypothetical protein